MAADVRADGRQALSDTIYALSSGAPPAAVALVRISGPQANAALEALAGSLPQARRASLATLREDGQVLDNALVIRFPGPATATGEDVAELHLHGGRSVVAAVLGALGRIEGLRGAEPGEFTRRAFENGRIDLVEAEGLADLIEAETEAQRRAALALAGGALSRQVGLWRERLLALAARVEADLDFSDEGDVPPADLSEPLAELAADLRAFLQRPSAERLREGIRVVIAGPPNAGKSSLLNALAGRNAAITSSSPGTTRDVIEAPVAIEGIPFLLADTAGLRAAEDGIEQIGVELARDQLALADIVLWLGPPADLPQGENVILVHPKADLGRPVASNALAVSAETGQGINDLIRKMIQLSSEFVPPPGGVALNRRQRAAIIETFDAVEAAQASSDPVIVAECLREARRWLDRLTGKAGVEDMLDTLFGRFCIGK